MPVSRTVTALAACTLAALVALVALSGAPGARAADVEGDDGGDRYVGSGGLILPASVPESTRRTVAGCQECSWRLTTPCVQSGLGTPFAGQGTCTSVVRGCPGGQLLRTWFRGHGSGWRDLGLVCLGPAGPVTVAAVADAVHDRVVQDVPPLRPTAQPARGVVTQLPVLFQSGQPGGAQRWPMAVLGTRIEVTATPTWQWSFGDGGGAETSDPGRHYPVGGVAHAYRTAGERGVVVRAVWSATFVVDGLGPFRVDEPVRQEAAVVVAVGEGRAVLTPPARDGRRAVAE
jgi:hypothetical protein